jgi:hypothetical protein
MTLTEIGKRLEKKALDEVDDIVMPDYFNAAQQVDCKQV